MRRAVQPLGVGGIADLRRETRLKSVEAPDEAPTTSTETFSDIKCNISTTTNYMINGITEVRSRGSLRVDCA